MVKNIFYKLMSLCGIIVSTSLFTSAGDRPNILFLFCDDLGYGDVGVFYQNQRKPSEPRLHTPHIDKLAKEGIQLRAHYVAAPVCAPSRASLFLGQTQGNSPVRNNQFDKALPDQPTLASTLKQAGYHTGLIGKWGMQGKLQKKGKNQKKKGKGQGKAMRSGNDSELWPSYPTKRGFDYYLGSVAHVHGHEHYPYDRVHKKKSKSPIPIWEQDKEISSQLKGCYSTDLFTAAAKRFLIEHKKSSSDQPFFLFLSYDTPHAATQIATSPYPKGFGVNGGVQWIGKEGEMINTATTGEADSYIHPDYQDKEWKNVYKRYASSIRRIDNSVEDLVQTLKDLKLHENTLIVFSSDHGPTKESYIKEQLDPSFFQSFGPFTGIKRDCWEGGIRPGAIVKWPGKISPNSISEAPSQMQDWMPTFCELANTSIPAIADGVSLLPTLTGKGTQQASKIYVEFLVRGSTPKYKQFPKQRAGQKRGSMQAVRVGNFKAVRYNIKSADDPFLVFDLSKDPAEANDLAGQGGIPDQAYWMQVVSRLHHTNPTAKTPYEGMLVAPIEVADVKPGTQVIPAKPEASKDYLSRDSFQIKGYIKVDKAGIYKFSFPKGTKGILRVHSIHLLDRASKQSYENDNSLNLGQGLHPFTLYLDQEAKASDVLLWKAEDAAEMTAIPTDHFFH